MGGNDVRALVDSGVPLWVIVAVMLALAAGSAVPKVLGPLGALLERWTTGRQRAISEAEAAEQAARVTEVTEAREQRDRARAALAEAEDRIWRHRVWDLEAMDALPPGFPPPPSLLIQRPSDI